MNFEQELKSEYDRELLLTRKMIDAIPADADLTWKANPKSMTIGRLAAHIAEAAGYWGVSTLTMRGFDLIEGNANRWQPTSKAEILEKFDTDTAQVKQILAQYDSAKWDEPWSLGAGERIFFTDSRFRVFRTWVLNHQFHHRAQLGRDLRAFGAPIPGIYGPSADES
jgi:uncharacterized damage-inducible protein DinB